MPIQLIKDFKYLPTVQYTQCSCMALCCVHINRMIESDVVSAQPWNMLLTNHRVAIISTQMVQGGYQQC